MKTKNKKKDGIIMALNSDIAYKFGCGRYVQGKDALHDCLAEEINRLGKKPLFVMGYNGAKAAEAQIKEALDKDNVSYETLLFHSSPCFENARDIVAYAREKDCLLLCGVGGGVLMDTVKLAAEEGGLSLMQIPTSSATCAASTPLSVLYDRVDGHHLGSYKTHREADCVIADTGILASQPKRLFFAGVLDSMAKSIEILHHLEKDGASPMGLDMAYVLAKTMDRDYETLLPEAEQALDKHCPNDAFEKLVFDAIAMTGIVSGISKGSNQCAIAHKFYEATRSSFYYEAQNALHGELVAMGLLVQLAYGGKDPSAIRCRLIDMGLPTRLSEIHVPVEEHTLTVYTDKICRSSAINDDSPASRAAVRQALMAIYA
ncbi:MAG: iron-containing alcohol dehydrogenase [Clostridia bacterium]|nr:iron-containing alcohol dehydrogenase [Clostridia bacterium]